MMMWYTTARDFQLVSLHVDPMLSLRCGLLQTMREGVSLRDDVCLRVLQIV